MKNIFVTGIPRSGTSLLTSLIDTAPNAVGLHEPHWQAQWAQNNKKLGKEAFVSYLENNFTTVRERLLNKEPVIDRRAPDGKGLTNYYLRSPDGKILQTYKLKPIKQKPLTETFTLAMKHCGLYIGVLEEIAKLEAFHVVAIIRNKKDVLSSWDSLPNIPPNKGRFPGAELFCPDIRSLLANKKSIKDKQHALYDYAYEKITTTANVEVIFHEDLVSNKFHSCSPLDFLEIDYSIIKKGST